MEVCDIVLRRGTALDKMQIRSLRNDDEGMLKLAGPRGVQPEIRLQGDFNLYSRRYIYKGASGPDRPVKSRELVIRRRNELHKMLLHHLLIFAG